MTGKIETADSLEGPQANWAPSLPIHGQSSSWRRADSEPYTDGVTADALMERFEEVRQREPRVRHSRQDYAPAVSSYRGSSLC